MKITAADVAAAIEIGFIAPVPQERIRKVGNAAAQGARLLLLSRSKRESIERLIRKAHAVILTTEGSIDGPKFGE